ncbi:hypothetical protein [Phaffia rhodozyma]|uniref:Uncharacterized protein n=1 Tax=Phaffia rhodozyma TaxID=264483 RepID=A0A0F7SR20_PHARH|nr:hypothetical protein [Phaffia rhodozyma]
MHTRRIDGPDRTSLLVVLALLSNISHARPILALDRPIEGLWSKPIIEHLIPRNESMPFDSISDTGEVEAPKQNITPLVTGLTAGLLVFFLSVILGWMYYRHVVRKARRRAQQEEEEEERKAEKNERETKVRQGGTRGDRSRTKQTMSPSGSKPKRPERTRERAQRPTSRPRAELERESEGNEPLSISNALSILPSNMSSTTLSSIKTSMDRMDWNSAAEPTELTQTGPPTPNQAFLESSSRSGSVSSASGSTNSSDSERTRFEVNRSDKFVHDVKGT